MGAVALIPPAAARLRGAHLIEDIKASQRFPTHIAEGLEFAQKRWPRLFGHLTEVSTPSADSLKKYPRGIAFNVPLSEHATKLMQSMYPGMQKQTGRFSAIELNPKALTNSGDAVETVGHELLHAADNLVRPDYGPIMQLAENLPGGYPVSSHELRARAQGAKTYAYSTGAPRGRLEIIDSGTGGPPEIYPKLDPRVGTPISVNDIPEVPTSVINEDPTDKIYRLVRERMERQKQGIRDPRVPNPKKDK
jgi:hypothetical protein